MVPRRGGALLPCGLLALAAAGAGWPSGGRFGAFLGGRRAPTSAVRQGSTLAAGTRGHRYSAEPLRTALQARGGDSSAEEDNEAVEVGGFAGFIVGLALLPHIIYALNVAIGVAINGGALSFGPFGITVISFVTTVGVTCWSLGSFVQRGMGLPAGPLGLLGLAEGLSYLGTLGVIIALVSSGVRSGSFNVSSPAAEPTISTSAPAPKAGGALKAGGAPKASTKDLFSFDEDNPFPSAPIKTGGAKAPAVKAPEIKVPEFKAPDIKVPDFNVPDFKVPDFKLPDVKVPDVKVPDFKAPEPAPAPKPPAPEPKPAPKPEPPKPAPKPAEPKPAPKPPPTEAASSTPSFSDLFD